MTISKGNIEMTKERYTEVENCKVTFLYIFMSRIFFFVLEANLLLFVCQLLFQMKILYSAISSQQGFLE